MGFVERSSGGVFGFGKCFRRERNDEGEKSGAFLLVKVAMSPFSPKRAPMSKLGNLSACFWILNKNDMPANSLHSSLHTMVQATNNR